MTPTFDRGELRASGRKARQSVVEANRTNAEAAIGSHLASLALSPRSLKMLSPSSGLVSSGLASAGLVVGVFISDDGEPDISRWAEAHVAAGGRVALPVPLADKERFAMEFRPWQIGEELVPGRFAIPCPPPRSSVEPDVLLVPLVRFDTRGNRLGRGGGFYDRFLATRSPRTIGIAFEAQRAVALPVEPHDVPLAVIVTELGVRLCQTSPDGRE